MKLKAQSSKLKISFKVQLPITARARRFGVSLLELPLSFEFYLLSFRRP